MPLGTIAPWLQLPDFARMAEAGAQIGMQQKKAADDLALGRERNAQAAAEAAGRLSLGFTEATNAAQKAKAEQELAKAAMALHQDRYSDLNKQAGEKIDLSRDRFNGLEDNRDVVNDFHDRSLDATIANRDAVNALRGTRLPGSGRGGSVGAGGNPAEKPFPVKVPIPANAQTGEPAKEVTLPSTHPAAIAFLKAHNLLSPNAPDENGIYTPTNVTHSGEVMNAGLRTPPVPAQQGTAGDAQALQPRNNLYMGAKTESPVFEPKPMPPEELTTATQPAQNVLDKATAATFLKKANGDKGAARKLAREAGYQF